MKKLLFILCVFLLAPMPAFAVGSQTFTSSGTFTVPTYYDSLTVKVWGGGGGGAGNGNGGNGGQSKFNTGTPLVANGGSGASGTTGGNGGTASGGTTNTTGGRGEDGGEYDDYAPSNENLYCDAGGEGGSPGGSGSSAGRGGSGYENGDEWEQDVDGEEYTFCHTEAKGGGGAGGYTTRTYAPGALTPGSTITVTIGSAGAAGSGGGGVGTKGEVQVTWDTCSNTTATSKEYLCAGSYNFTIPSYGTVIVETWGGGGGGGSGGWNSANNAGTGGDSRFNSATPVIGRGGLGGKPSTYCCSGNGPGGAGGGYSGGDTGDAGRAGDSASEAYNTSGKGGRSGGTSVYGTGGATVGPGNTPGLDGNNPGGGGSGGSRGISNDGGGGGGGGYARKTFNVGQLTVGANIGVTIGAGGAGGGHGGGLIYTMNGGDGADGRVKVTWTNAATCSITVATNPINYGGSTTLSWTSTGADWFYITGIGYVATSGSTTVAPLTTTTYDGTVGLTSQSASGTCTRTLTVNTPPVPTVTTNVPSSITTTTVILDGTGNPNGTAATGWFRYSATNPGACTDSFGTRHPSSGGTSLGSGSTGVNFTRSLTGLSAGTTYYYCAIASNTGGIGLGTIRSFTTLQNPPVVTFTRSPASIAQGQSSTLTWSATGATTCTGSGAGFSTGGATSGSDPVSPTQTTVYTVSCTGAGGTTAPQVTVTVTCTPTYTCSGNDIRYTDAACAVSTITTCVAPSFCSTGSAACLYDDIEVTAFGGGDGHLEVRPSLIRLNDTAQVYWNVENVTSCTVAGDNGDSWTVVGNAGNNWTSSSGASGRTTAAITQKTTYTLTCTAFSGVTPPTLIESVDLLITPVFQEV